MKKIILLILSMIMALTLLSNCGSEIRSSKKEHPVFKEHPGKKKGHYKRKKRKKKRKHRKRSKSKSSHKKRDHKRDHESRYR